MFTINVQADVKPVQDYLNRLKAGLGDRVVVSALNKTVEQGKTQMQRAIAAEYNVKVSDIREKLGLERARKAGQKFTATLSGNPFGLRKRSLNLVRFLVAGATRTATRRRGTAGTKQGRIAAELRFRIRRAGGVIGIPGTFILPVKGNPVFIRIGKGRSAIEPAQVIGIPQMFNARKINDPVRQSMEQKFGEIFAHEFKFFESTIR
jgi:minor tail protein Z (GPZ)